MLIKCIFSDDMIRQPILYELGHRFSVVTNIQQAMVTSESGWVVLEIIGEEQAIISGIEWFKNIGVEVELLEKED